VCTIGLVHTIAHRRHARSRDRHQPTDARQ
jgi:hypothetical protein